MRNGCYEHSTCNPIIGEIKYAEKFPYGCVTQKQYDADMLLIKETLAALKKAASYFTLVLEEGDDETLLDEYCHLKLVND